MITEAIKIETGGADKSVKELRKELKSLKDQMLSNEKGTEEYTEALKKAAEIQHTLKEQMQEVNASSMDFGDRLGNVTKSINGVVGGITAATGALSLFGIENEEAQKKITATMTSLLGMVEGLSKIDEGVKAYKRLTLAINAGSGALGKFKIALISTGLGALVVVLGSIIAYWDDFTDAIGLSSEQLTALGDKAKGVINIITNGIKQIARTMGKLLKGDFGGALEEFKKGINVTDAYHQGVINSQKKREEEKTKKEQEEAEKRNKAAEKEAKEKARLAKQAADAAIKAEEERTRKVKEEIKKRISDAEREANDIKDMALAKLRGEDAEQNSLARFDIMMKHYTNLIELYQSQIKKLTELVKQGHTEYQDLLDDTTKTLKKTEIEYEQWWQSYELAMDKAYEAEVQKRKDLIKSWEDGNKSEKEKLDERYNLLKEAFEKEHKDLGPLVGWYEKELEKIQIGDAGDILERFESKMMTEQEQLDAEYQMYIEAARKTGEDTYEIEKWYTKEKTKLHVQSMTAFASAVGDILGTLSEMEEEGSQKQKNMATAAATIQMLVGITTALSGAFTTKSGPWDWALAIAQAASIAASGALQIKKINEVKPGSSSGSSSSFTPSINMGSLLGSVPSFSQSLDGAMTQGAIQDQRVYVTEHDITETQTKVKVTQQQATY